MRTFIYLDNYRGFSDTLIPLRRVNWLVGENSTGKTSFLELLEELSYPPFWLFEPRLGMKGNHARHFLDLISASAKRKTSFTIGALAMGQRTIDEADHGMIITYENLDGRAVPKRVSIVEGTTVRTVDGKLSISVKNAPYRSRIRDVPDSDDSDRRDAKAQILVSTHHSASGFKNQILPDERVGAPLFERFSETLFNGESIEERDVKVPFPFSSELVELAPIRTKPRRTYDAHQTAFSPEGEHTPYIIRKRLASKSKAEEFRQYLESAGKDSGLFQSIRIKEYGKGQRDPFEVQIVLGKTPLGLENVGYGVSQALPVLVEMYIRSKRTTYLIQQPEVHLHPKAQASFGDIVANLARSDEKRFVIETHSDFAIDRFRLNIRRNGVIPSHLLYFERTETGNKATSIAIDSSGNLAELQPAGYREFFYNESLDLLG